MYWCKNSINTELGPPVLIEAVMQSIKFSKILLSIILFVQRILSAQLRIHKRGCPVSPPRWLCLSDR